jgi:hypothetical protein
MNTRILHGDCPQLRVQPHERELPFTGELDNVKIPAGVTEIKGEQNRTND